VDFIAAEEPPVFGGGFFIDAPKALAPALADKLNFYKLRAKVTVENLSDALGVMAAWDDAALSDYGLSYLDPRVTALGARTILPPDLAAEAAADLNADFTDAEAYDAHRIALGVPRGGVDFGYGDTFVHEADMDQLHGVDFDKGCYVGQEVVSRVEHRATARSRVVPVIYEGAAPSAGLPVMAGEKQIGTFGSAANGHALALLRLDRVADALAAGTPITCGNIPIRVAKPDWAKFSFPGEAQPA
jgi:folate-binding protein YgfZ